MEITCAAATVTLPASNAANIILSAKLLNLIVSCLEEGLALLLQMHVPSPLFPLNVNAPILFTIASFVCTYLTTASSQGITFIGACMSLSNDPK